MSTQEDRKVPLRVSNNTAYLWNVDDITTLRSKHNICGILTGTLPHLSQQNVFLGIPLVLLPEEVVLLVENEMAVIVYDPTAHMQPTSEELKNWNKEQQDSFRQQITANEAKANEKENKRPLSEQALQKRKEREERKRLAVQKLAEEANTEYIYVPSPLPEKLSKENPETTIKLPQPPPYEQSIASASYTITIPAASEYQWYSSDKATFTTIVSAQKAGVWTYPSNLTERARCGVFRSLWAKGYFMGSGIKFGGDYLVYPGDPLRYHSHFVATVIESPSQTLRPMEVVAHGRLGTATKKSHLLCKWDDEKKEVSYLSIEWAGFG
ncbi:putative tRNA-splicing endonuclease subunit sen-34 [Leucoagaricus sp. SymC.cos]|nr:putative tRNA-splicing endonuclease subunit sen-34 [Leucoagaricus sp. SymC.cos]